MKSTKAEMELRAGEVYELLVTGATRHIILQYATKKWKISDRSIDELIARARKIIAAEQDISRHEAMVEALAIRQEIYFQAFEDKDWRTALKAAEGRAKLQGLYSTTEMAVVLLTQEGYKVFDGEREVLPIDRSTTLHCDSRVFL